MSQSTAVRVDKRGRLNIPNSIRDKVGVKLGDVFLLQPEDSDLHYSKAEKENPFDFLARHAIQEYKAGRTRDIREMAAEWGVDLERGR